MAYSRMSITALTFFALLAVAFAVPFARLAPQQLRIAARQSDDTVFGDEDNSSNGLEQISASPMPLPESELSPSDEPIINPTEPMLTTEPMIASAQTEPVGISEPVVTTPPNITIPPLVTQPFELLPVESPEEEECVDIAHLTAYPSHALVHEEHLTANVLCPTDSSLPCATANHMLRVDGKSVSYREYCETVSCTNKTTKVNSVFSHLWEEQTHRNGVVLTMFDGRHPEAVQRTLHRAMAAGRGVANRFR